MPPRQLRIGTRSSQLALWQANWVKTELESRYTGMEITLVKIRTLGDRVLDAPLSRVGGKGLFVKEIEEAMLRGDIDIAVHSMKDVPTVLPEGLGVRCITEREDPRDALISRYPGLSLLPQNARIGAGALRRQTQLLRLRPDFRMFPIRGNVETRIQKLEDENLDAIILAAAGLKRLGLNGIVTEYLDANLSIPAVGQGALGIECRLSDREITETIAFLNHPETSHAVRAERALLERCQGGCQTPIAAHGTVLGNKLRLVGFIASVDGQRSVRDEISGPLEQCEALGTKLADHLLSQGGNSILEEVYRHEIRG